VGTHNQFPEEKIRLRQLALERLSTPLRVVEFYAGHGVIRNAVYQDAEKWIGFDTDPETIEAIHVDCRLAARHIDLEDYNVFDVDAFADPWEVVWIISQRRSAVGSIVVFATDGDKLGQSMRAIEGRRLSRQQRDALGVGYGRLQTKGFTADRAVQEASTFFLSFFEKWELTGFWSGHAKQIFYYAAILTGK
jgi:hypothetical protein